MAEINNVTTTTDLQLSDTILTISDNRLKQTDLNLLPVTFYVGRRTSNIAQTIKLFPILLYDPTYVTSKNNILYFNAVKWSYEHSSGYYWPYCAAKGFLLNRFSTVTTKITTEIDMILADPKGIEGIDILNNVHADIFNPLEIPVQANDIIILDSLCRGYSPHYGTTGSKVVDYFYNKKDLAMIQPSSGISSPYSYSLGFLRYTYDKDHSAIDYSTRTLYPPTTVSKSTEGTVWSTKLKYYSTEYSNVLGFFALDSVSNIATTIYAYQPYAYTSSGKFILDGQMVIIDVTGGKGKVTAKGKKYEPYPVNGISLEEMKTLITNPEALSIYEQ